MKYYAAPARKSLPPPRMGIWSALPRALRTTQRKIPGYWQPLLFLPLLYGALASTYDWAKPPWLVKVEIAGLLMGIGFAVVWRVGELLALRTTSADMAFSDAPPGIDEYAVELVLYDSGEIVGVDRGIVWFEDGILTFNGTACSFALAAEDFYPRYGERGHRLHRGLPSDVLRFRVPGRTVYARLIPLLGPRGILFNYRLGRFLVGGTSSDRPRQWPPFEAHGVSAPKLMLRSEHEMPDGAAEKVRMTKGSFLVSRRF